MRLYFGAVAATISYNFSTYNNWRFLLEIVRTSSNNQLVTGIIIWGPTTTAANVQLVRQTLTQTDTANITIKTTGQISVSAAGAITSEYLSLTEELNA